MHRTDSDLGGGAAALAEVEAEVEGRLEDDQHEERADGGAEEGHHERAEDDRQVKNHHAAVDRAHLAARRGGDVLATPKVVQEERRSVAEEERDRPDQHRRPEDLAERPAGGALEREALGVEAQVLPGARAQIAGATEAGEARQREHEDPVDQPEHPVVEGEEDREAHSGDR
jgi:hypothetical protein